MKLAVIFGLLFLFAIVSAKKQQESQDGHLDETGDHNVKKYGKDQKVHHHDKHHTHKQHKKHEKEELLKEPEPVPKSAPIDVPEPEAKLQSDLNTDKKAVNEQHKKDQTQDLHLQDLAHEEKLKKEVKKKHHKSGHHHGAHQAETIDKNERKFFAEHEAKNPIKEKVLEDSFETLNEPAFEGKNKNKKQKDKSKNKKKAFEKGKGKGGKKSKGNKKNKDKKQKNKDKQRKY